MRTYKDEIPPPPPPPRLISFVYSGGQLCQIGDQWVVNPDGGLESKGIIFIRLPIIFRKLVKKP